MEQNSDNVLIKKIKQSERYLLYSIVGTKAFFNKNVKSKRNFFIQRRVKCKLLPTKNFRNYIKV